MDDRTDDQAQAAGSGASRTERAERRRARAAGWFAAAGSIVSLVALGLALSDGFEGAATATALAAALIGANLAPVVAVTGGRIDAFTPVGALLVPIGVLLPLPEAIVTYAVGEGLGVVLAHQWDDHVGGPEDDAAVRTGFVVGKSIIGAVVGLVAIDAVTGAEGLDALTALVAAFLGVGLSTAVDHTILASVTSRVNEMSWREEMVRGAPGLAMVALVEVVAGALIAVLAVRELASLLLGLGVIGLLALTGTAYARARTERESSQALLALADELQEATTTSDVDAALLRSLQRLLPEDRFELRDRRPEDDERGWRLRAAGHVRWIVTPRLVDTRDYEQQPRQLVATAIALAQVALNRAAVQERLVQQDELRSLILATVAHDLRSPLATATTALDTLSQRRREATAEQAEALLAAARRGVSRVRRLMDDLLDLELVEAVETTGVRADVGETISALLADLQLDVEVRLRRCDAEVALDPVSLGRIVENLATNAAKYSPPGGTVRVRCSARVDDRTGRNGVEIVVEDDGPGVSQDDRNAIFEPFQQVGKARGGSGLGLYVTRRFVEMGGGRVWVDDAPGGGAAFHVWLPSPDDAQAP